MGLLRKVGSFLVRGALAYENISVVALFLMAIIIFIEVIVRLAKISLFPLGEVCGTAVVIITFGVLGTLFIKERHVSVDIFINLIPYKQRQLAEAFLGILALCLTLILISLWWGMAYGMFERGSRMIISYTLRWPFEIFVMVGWLALIIGEVYFIVNKIKLFLHSSQKE